MVEQRADMIGTKLDFEHGRSWIYGIVLYHFFIERFVHTIVPPAKWMISWPKKPKVFLKLWIYSLSQEWL
jgi:hypothetical protein